MICAYKIDICTFKAYKKMFLPIIRNNNVLYHSMAIKDKTLNVSFYKKVLLLSEYIYDQMRFFYKKMKTRLNASK